MRILPILFNRIVLLYYCPLQYLEPWNFSFFFVPVSIFVLCIFFNWVKSIQKLSINYRLRFWYCSTLYHELHTSPLWILLILIFPPDILLDLLHYEDVKWVSTFYSYDHRNYSIHTSNIMDSVRDSFPTFYDMRPCGIYLLLL